MGIWNWWKQDKSNSKPETEAVAPSADLDALCRVLRELIDLLDADKETHWRDWMAESLTELETNNLRGARHLMGAYGGMGSFNDLIIGQQMTEDGFNWAPNAGKNNDRLDELRSQAYNLAKALL